MKKVMFIVVGMLFAASVNAATVNYYNTLGSFEASHLNGSVEQFEDTTLNSGLIITSTNAGFSISDGVMNDKLVAGSGNSTVFEIPGLVNAFGGMFDLDVELLGQGITFSFQALAGDVVVLSQELTSSGFFGFVTDIGSAFNKVILTAGTSSGNAETYTLDDLRYGLHTPAVTPSAVPIPAALWLFAPALVGFFGFRRKAAVAA